MENLDLQPLASGEKEDNESLVNVLKSCFSDLISSNSERLDKLNKAVEALHPKTPVVDKKSAFWNAYKEVSEEYDKEFQHKYSSDLESSLIFAGLFSAVASGFIIQIQPQLQQDPNTVNQALLRLLIHSVDNSVFTGSQILIPEWNGPSSIIVTVQILLYVSLFSTLLAALFAVLGKQWLMYYGAAGDRGNIEQRCLERQRKVDAIRRWGFDLVMQLSPVLQQFSLLLFAVALCIYLWTIHPLIAGMVLLLTSLGIVLYTLLGLSPAISPDSPFQTPVSSFLIKLIPEEKRRSLRVASEDIQHGLFRVSGQVWRFLTMSRAEAEHFTHSEKISDCPAQSTIFHSKDGATSENIRKEFSSVASAVLWVLEISTDPTLITTAASVAADPDLQWPSDLNLEAQLTRLSDTFAACFTLDTGEKLMNIREAHVQRAIHCGQAYGILKVNSRHKANSLSLETLLETYSFSAPQEPLEPQVDELNKVLDTLRGSTTCFREPSTASFLRWALRVIPSRRLSPLRNSEFTDFIAYFPWDHNLDPVDFANYLLCMSVFLGFRPSFSDLTVMDKSGRRNMLLATFFKELTTRLSRNALDQNIAVNLVKPTIRLARQLDAGTISHSSALKTEIYRFCSILHFRSVRRQFGWINVLLLAAKAARSELMDVVHHMENDVSGTKLTDVSWIYEGLEYVHKTWVTRPMRRNTDLIAVMEDLLQALIHAKGFHQKPNSSTLNVILHALSLVGSDISRLAFFALHYSRDWFDDAHLRPILQQRSTLSVMRRIADQNGGRTERTLCLEIVGRLSGKSDWKPILYDDLPGWIDFILHTSPDRDTMQTINSILLHVWGTGFPSMATYRFRNEVEETMGYMFAALANRWHKFDFISDNFLGLYVPLARCTLRLALKVRYPGLVDHLDENSSLRLRPALSGRLAEVLLLAAQNSRNSKPENIMNDDIVTKKRDCLETVAMILERIVESLDYQDQFTGSSSLIAGGKTIQESIEKDIARVKEYDPSSMLRPYTPPRDPGATPATNSPMPWVFDESRVNEFVNEFLESPDSSSDIDASLPPLVLADSVLPTQETVMPRRDGAGATENIVLEV